MVSERRVSEVNVAIIIEAAHDDKVRDLLPGTYSFGITGRGPGGEVLGPGTYQLRLVAWPTLGTRPSRAQVAFRILPA